MDFKVFHGLTVFNVSQGCGLESATFTLYVPETVSSRNLTFLAMDLPEDLLDSSITDEPRDQRIEGLLASLRNIKPAAKILQNRSSPIPGGQWQTPEILTTTFSSLALVGVLSLAAICVYAGGSSQATS